MQQTFLFAICLAVIIPATWTIQKSVPKSECRQMMDMVVVVDGSDSILEKDYTKQRHAIKDMIEGMEVGENASRVGLVVFSTGIAQLVNLTGSLKVLRNKSLELEHPRDGTETHVGINAMMQMFKDHGREKVPWVCLVITDGLSKKPRLTKKASRKAKERGINIFAVGISHEIMQEELQNIASSPDQVLMLQTFDQLQVSLMSLMKVVCPCPDPPMVPHGIVDKGTRSIGSNRTYICEEGYQPIGMPRIRCKKDSTWTTLEFSCNACPDPLPVYRNGYVTEGLNLLLSTRQYICLKGHTAPEPLIAVCEAGPKGPFWKMPEKGCLACHKPPRFRDGYLDMKIVDTLVGTTRFYHCDEGFIATGPIETTCIDDKGIPTWTKPSHRCIACKKPPKLDYAVVDTTGGNRIGMKRIYKCIPGYHPTGPIEALCLGEKGAAFWKTSEHFCTACKEPPTVPNAVLHKDGDSLVGSVRTYICLKGFQPTGPIEVKCKTSPGVAYWDGPKHKCVACIPPPVLPHAILDPLGDTLVGSIRNYNCMKGYIPNGPIEVGCIEGTGGPLWTSAEYHCIACPTPPPVQHALMDQAGDDLVGSKRLYHCMKGYIPSIAGPIIRECIGEYDVAKRRGKAYWSDPSHYCKACPDPPPIEFGKVEHGDSLIGSTRSYICLKGFYATGPIRIRCEKDGTWTKPKHSCTACGPVPFVDHADVDDGSHQLGTIRYYKCHQGYTHTNTPTIVCLKDAKWSAVNFSCVACEKPYGLKNAVLEPGENLIGIVRRYTCLPGYLATGPITSTCAVPPKMMKPDWSTPVHYCKDCGDPYPVDNAIPMKGQRTIGAVQQYVCKKGYVPSAPPLSHCMPNAEWTPPEFTCVDDEDDRRPSRYRSPFRDRFPSRDRPQTYLRRSPSSHDRSPPSRNRPATYRNRSPARDRSPSRNRLHIRYVNRTRIETPNNRSTVEYSLPETSAFEWARPRLASFKSRSPIRTEISSATNPESVVRESAATRTNPRLAVTSENPQDTETLHLPYQPLRYEPLMRQSGPAGPATPPFRPPLSNQPRGPSLPPLTLPSETGSAPLNLPSGSDLSLPNLPSESGFPSLNLPSGPGLRSLYLPDGNGISLFNLPGRPVIDSNPNLLMPPLNFLPRIFSNYFIGNNANLQPQGPTPPPTSLSNDQFVIDINANSLPPGPAPSPPSLSSDEFVIGINGNPPPVDPALPPTNLLPFVPPPTPPQVRTYYTVVSNRPLIRRGSPASFIATNFQTPVIQKVAAMSKYFPNQSNNNKHYGINFRKYSQFPVSAVLRQSHPIRPSYYKKYFPATSYYRKYFPTTST